MHYNTLIGESHAESHHHVINTRTSIAPWTVPVRVVSLLHYQGFLVVYKKVLTMDIM